MIRWPLPVFIGSATCLLATSSLAQEISPRIIDGTNATSNDWPYITALVTKGSSAYEGQFCGGSYIGDRYILTAAHCVERVSKEDFEVIVGINNLNNEHNEGVRLPVQQFYIHPEYNGNNLKNDIAIIELPRPLTSNEAIPVQLADAQTRNSTAVGTDLTVAGWGSTTPELGNHTTSAQLLEVTVPMVDQNTCADAFPSVTSGSGSENFCAGYQYEGYDSCRGDSGGPLVIDNDRTQLGIVSFGSIRCGYAGSYGVYTNISRYVDWIEQVTSGLSYSQSRFAGYKNLGQNRHKFTFTNISKTYDITNIHVSTGYSEVEVLSNKCALDGTLPVGESCSVTVQFDSAVYGLDYVGVTFDYQQNGNVYSVDSHALYEIAKSANPDLAEALSIQNVDVYSYEHPWQVTSDGVRSAPINHNERSTLILDGLPPGYYTFDVRVSSEVYDQSTLYVNSQSYFPISGEWKDEVEIYLPAASNRIKFDYRKNSAVDAGEDAVFISNFRSTSNPDSTSDASRSGGGGGSFGWLSLVLLLPLLRRKH
ncbi:S1 family peptidase [Vibrio nereis]|uniref:S1 family peptidase n=1 Tax=Vibrio nereis TaxID=693 RepID=UPI00249422FB|nr:trypsin-like serine protease [Vibrio nereis]